MKGISTRESLIVVLLGVLRGERQWGFTNDSYTEEGIQKVGLVWQIDANKHAMLSKYPRLIKYICTLLKYYGELDKNERGNVVRNILELLDPDTERPTQLVRSSTDANAREDARVIFSAQAAYSGGHPGLDHSIRYYRKGRGFVGTLTFDSVEGITFAPTNTMTRQVVRMHWKSISDITSQVSSGFLFIWKPKTRSIAIRYHNQKGNSLHVGFSVDEAPEFSSRVGQLLSQYRKNEDAKEQMYHRYVYEQRLTELPPYRFEMFVRDLFEKMGFNCELTKQSADGGVDVVMFKDGEKFVAQCKRYKGLVGEPILRDLMGTMTHEKATKGFLVTTGSFSQPAKKWSQGKNIELIDKFTLAGLVKRFIASDFQVELLGFEHAKNNLLNFGNNHVSTQTPKETLATEPIRLLIVDDISETLAIYRKLLYYEDDIEIVGEAKNGVEAIEQFDLLSPDIMVICINMPVMDGFAASEEICTRHPDAKIIVASVQDGADYIRRAMLAGAREYLIKPFSGEELSSAIHRVVGREAAS
jgi:CheY-like chemotaxis protein